MTAVASLRATAQEKQRALSPLKAHAIIAVLYGRSSRESLVQLYRLAIGFEPGQMEGTTDASLFADVVSATSTGRLLLIRDFTNEVRGVPAAPSKAPYPPPQKQEIQLFVRAYAPFETFGRLEKFGHLLASFGGDRRAGPSTNTADTARLTYVLPIQLTEMQPDAIAKKAFCDPSHGTGLAALYVGRALGATYDRATSSVTKTATARSSQFFEPVGRPGTGFAGYIEVAASNPLLPSPDIDLRLNIKIVRETDRLHIVGNMAGDRFPNAEAFVRDANSRGVLLVDFRTDGDRDSGPLERLPGHGYTITSAFDVWQTLNADGTFK
jgi:hypothetical protein